MSQTKTSRSQSDAVALNAAFAALETYNQGSSRGALLPIDQAVKASLGDEPARAALEQRLVGALQRGGSSPAVEFICSKLAMIGTKSSVAALAALLGKPEFATAARNALEAITGGGAAKALREALPKLSGLEKAGVIHSLAVRRDTGSARLLTVLLRDTDPVTAGAALAALGDIGSVKAAKTLRAFAPKAPEAIRLQVADAALVCADALIAAGKKSEGRTLAQMLDVPEQPKHVRQAAARLLALQAGKP